MEAEKYLAGHKIESLGASMEDSVSAQHNNSRDNKQRAFQLLFQSISSVFLFDLFNRKIALTAAESKVEVCEFLQGLAGQNCACARCNTYEFIGENHPEPHPNIALNHDTNSTTGPRTLIDELRKIRY